MSSPILQLLPVIILFITGWLMIAAIGWRVSLAALSIQYVVVFILLSQVWPVAMASSLLIAGGITVIVLFTVRLNVEGQGQADAETQAEFVLIGGESRLLSIAGYLFYFFAAILVVLVVISATPNLIDWISEISPLTASGALLLIGLGLLHLSLTAQPLRIVVGLLTVLSGFEIIYAAVEFSTLVAGLLAGVHMGLSVVGCYFIIAPGLEGGE